ncbi:hypothetical protein I4U23_004950 [Adineta vaga]|nr:hypothetical protein I4U23_004950 [Adineta vaga]
MAESAETNIRNENQFELQDMTMTDVQQQFVTYTTLKQKKSPRTRFSFIFQRKILWTLLSVFLIVSVSTAVWISRHTMSQKENNMMVIQEQEMDDELPQLRSYRYNDKSEEDDDIGYLNVFIRKDADDRSRRPERFRFPAARYDRRRIPVNGPFFHFMPRIPIFADRLTKQTLIFSTSGGVYILPPLVNNYGKLFSVAELIASGYASLVSSGVSPTGPINMVPFFQPTPLIGPNIPVLRPRHGGFVGGIRTKLESISIPKDYYRPSNLYSTIDEMNDDESEYEDDNDHYRPSHSYNRPTRKPSTTTSYPNNIDQIQKKLKKSTENIVQTFRQGICAEMILNSTVRDQYISKNLIGRVLPLGTFSSTELAVEYLYGILCTIPNLPPRTNLFDTVDIIHLTYDAKYYRVSFKIQVNFISKKRLFFFGIFAFAKDMKLCGYEAVIQNAGLTFDFPLEQRTFVISSLCQGVQTICPVGSSNEQYASVSECISFLSEPQTPFGTYDRGDQNNVICRTIHLSLASIAPDIHCPHVGKTGGGACTNKTPESYFEGTSDFVSCAYQYQK